MLTLLEDEDFFNADVYLTPPNDGQISDEDSHDDDDPQQYPDHFSGKQIQARAEFTIKYPTKIVNSMDAEGSHDEMS